MGCICFKPPTQQRKFDNFNIKTKALLGSQAAWEVIEKGYKETQDETILPPNQMDFLKDMGKREKKLLTSTINQWMKVLLEDFKYNQLQESLRDITKYIQRS